MVAPPPGQPDEESGNYRDAYAYGTVRARATRRGSDDCHGLDLRRSDGHGPQGRYPRYAERCRANRPPDAATIRLRPLWPGHELYWLRIAFYFQNRRGLTADKLQRLRDELAGDNGPASAAQFSSSRSCCRPGPNGEACN